MTAIEHTFAGPQHMLPGTEKASDATMAQRSSAKPLRPRVPQVPCNIGLFSDDAAQADLLDLMGRDRPARSARPTAPIAMRSQASSDAGHRCTKLSVKQP